METVEVIGIALSLLMCVRGAFWALEEFIPSRRSFRPKGEEDDEERDKKNIATGADLFPTGKASTRPPEGKPFSGTGSLEQIRKQEEEIKFLEKDKEIELLKKNIKELQERYREELQSQLNRQKGLLYKNEFENIHKLLKEIDQKLTNLFKPPPPPPPPGGEESIFPEFLEKWNKAFEKGEQEARNLLSGLNVSDYNHAEIKDPNPDISRYKIKGAIFYREITEDKCEVWIIPAIGCSPISFTEAFEVRMKDGRIVQSQDLKYTKILNVTKIFQAKNISKISLEHIIDGVPSGHFGSYLAKKFHIVEKGEMIIE